MYYQRLIQLSDTNGEEARTFGPDGESGNRLDEIDTLGDIDKFDRSGGPV